MPDPVELNRLRWRCRRGMLENDLVLGRFMDEHGATLEGKRLEAFRRLLELSDGELWDLICGRARTDDPEITEILALLRDQ